MLTGFTPCWRHRGRLKYPQKFCFASRATCIIGPNGSGKSTLLRAIHECNDCQKIEDQPTRYHFYDGERMNPHLFGKTVKGLKGNAVAIRARYSSHGETLRDVLGLLNFTPGDCLLLDEPETGQDLNWILRIRKGLIQAARAGCQIICASHHPAFAQKFARLELKRNYWESLRHSYSTLFH